MTIDWTQPIETDETPPRPVRVLTAEHLRNVLDYDPCSGVFTWKVRGDIANKNNARLAGKVAGAVNSHGYVHIGINQVRYKAHRLAWMYVHGEMPTGQLDHINGDRIDNRLSNLRLVSHRENAINSSIRSDNSSGFRGVHWCKAARRWIARITINRKTKNLGAFDSREAAIKRYEDVAASEFGEFKRQAGSAKL